MQQTVGKPYPLGATWDGKGVNFAIFSESATRVELCLFDSLDQPRENVRIELRECTDHVWHCYLPDARPGQLYNYRVDGSYNPASGQRFNPNKLVTDPYAKWIARSVRWDNALFGYEVDGELRDLGLDTRDSASFAPLSAVVDPAFTWGDDVAPRTPWHQTIIYEAHVKSLTINHPDVPESIRGTYTAIASEPIISHLKSLGITALELLPVHQHIGGRHLQEKHLSDYWGYNTLSYFAPDVRYALRSPASDPVREFKMMVRALHAAGIEVILDVVYNHTAEGNELGPTLCFRGVENASYYRLVDNDPRYYMDFTGCGNTLNMRHPRVLQLVMDSLRYWVTEMHVDGFRFDLASALARELFEVDRLASFFDVIHQDPIISQVKLIAEPWDLSEGGYQVGNFPVLWTEWNGSYRDSMRSFWKGDNGVLPVVASRLAGSSDLYAHSGKRPYASINFITCHDGFTLEDLVSYNHKHNEKNGEGNRDGADDNNSWNCGAEGPTSDPAIIALREQQKRNLMATLLLSAGVPMISGGDELSRTQEGNNNAYCQDNEINWFDWNLDDRKKTFLEFIRQLVAIRKSQPLLQRRRFFTGEASKSYGLPDLIWFAQNGEQMTDVHWAEPEARTLAACFVGDGSERDEQGNSVSTEILLLLLNSHWESANFTMPQLPLGEAWELLVTTGQNSKDLAAVSSGADFELSARSCTLFRLIQGGNGVD